MTTFELLRHPIQSQRMPKVTPKVTKVIRSNSDLGRQIHTTPEITLTKSNVRVSSDHLSSKSTFHRSFGVLVTYETLYNMIGEQKTK